MMREQLKTIFSFLSIFSFLMMILPAFAATSPRWLLYNSRSYIQVYQAPWQNFLTQYVHNNASGLSLVAYGQVSPVDRYTITAYLAELEQIPVSQLNRLQQLAYWINLYNAMIVAIILKNYPLQSVREINLGVGLNPQGVEVSYVQVEGVPISLNEIENNILRPIWHDIRVNYLLCCGAIGCPNLPTEALTPSNINEVLNSAVTAYVNSDRAVRIDHDQLLVSEFYLWHRQEFGGSDQAIIDHLISYANPHLKSQLKQFHKINGSFFDWTLNGS